METEAADVVEVVQHTSQRASISRDSCSCACVCVCVDSQMSLLTISHFIAYIIYGEMAIITHNNRSVSRKVGKETMIMKRENEETRIKSSEHKRKIKFTFIA